MEWTNSACLKLINLYREREVLWNPVHNDYKNKIKKLDAWNDISKIMKGDTGEVKKKMESLLTSFRRERQKQDNSFKTGSGTDTIFKSSWFAFKDMLFLMDKFIPKETKNTEVSQNIYSFMKCTTEKNLPFLQFNSILRYYWKETIASRKPRDDSTIFGEHVAAKPRKYSVHTQSEVEHLIGDILYKADKGLYEHHVSPISSIGHKQYYFLQPNQQTYTSITPSTTPNPYNQYSSVTQSTSTPFASPSASICPFSPENESVFLASPSNLTLQQTDNSQTSITRFINSFTDST
ncbi:uncharacterized protein [Leptinotarsa decemlineata]|uniref:uncharacterized protein n=1 Tax=Leptinotarsa decemlineata TaxID=7539 RepID=UPI003D307DAC